MTFLPKGSTASDAGRRLIRRFTRREPSHLTPRQLAVLEAAREQVRRAGDSVREFHRLAEDPRLRKTVAS